MDGKINIFAQLSSKDISKFIEKKGNFDYFPWADAHSAMKQFDPTAEVKVREFKHSEILKGELQEFLIEKELNYQTTKGGAYVHVFVTIKGRTEDEMYPITDSYNNPVVEPKTTDVNKALKRAFVKSLAKHGLGLYVYRGEELPQPIKIDIKEVEKIEKLLQSVYEITGEDYLPSLLENVNELTLSKGLIADTVEKIEDFTIDQSGLAKRMIGKKTLEVEKLKKQEA